MNKIYTLAAILLLISVSLSAQTYGGIRAGLTISSLSGGDAGTYNPKLGLHAGLTSMTFLHPNLVFQPELLYSQRGATRESNIGGIKSVFTTKLDYLEMPLALKLNIQTPDLKLQPFLAAELRYLLSQKQKTEITIGGSTSSSTEDIDSFKDWDYGLALGIDLFISDTIELGMRYNLGAAKIVKPNSSGDSPEIYNYGLMLSLGILY